MNSQRYGVNNSGFYNKSRIRQSFVEDMFTEKELEWVRKLEEMIHNTNSVEEAEMYNHHIKMMVGKTSLLKKNQELEAENKRLSK